MFNAVVVLACLLTAAAPSPPLKVYLLAGQSNMAGYSTVRWLEENAATLLRPRDDAWCYWQGECRLLQPGSGINEDHFGLELSFGHALADALDNPILLCKFAIGGTSLYEEWRSPTAVARAGGRVGPLYVDMMQTFHRILASPARWVPGSRAYEIAGFVWFQGEEDACVRTKDGVGYWEDYAQGLRDLISDIRSHVGVPDLPVCVVQISRFDRWEEDCEGGDTVRSAQEQVTREDDRAVLVVTHDLESSHHYGHGDQKTIGERVARALLPLTRVTRPTDPAAVAEARRRAESTFGLRRERLAILLVTITAAHLVGALWLITRWRQLGIQLPPRWQAAILVAWPVGLFLPLWIALRRPSLPPTAPPP